jgi:hypothetical protein
VTVILTLAAVIRYYLPRRDANLGNHLGELLREVREMKEADLQHHAREEVWQAEVVRTLERIEAKLEAPR